MNLTNEQKQIINSKSKNIVIQALAGTGKTTTLVEYTKAHPEKNFLYLAFNKAIVDESKRKFGKNVKVQTVHGLAYQWFTYFYPNKLITGFTPFKQLEMFFKDKGHVLSFPTLLRVNNLLKSFYASNHETLSEVKNINGGSYSEKDREFANLILEDLKDKSGGTLNVTHDFYLKLFQLEKVQYPNYDCVLFDESQDSNDVITAIVLNQNCSKIFVGDKHQAIYQFRGSRDALTGFEKKADEVLFLTQTFRYGDNLAKIASDFLHNYKSEKKTIKGLETDTKVSVYNLNSNEIDDTIVNKEIINIIKENKKINNQTCYISYTNLNILNLIKSVFDYNEENPNEQITFKLNGDLSKYNFDMIKVIYEILKVEKKSKQEGKKSLKIEKVFKEYFTDSFSDGSGKINIDKNVLSSLKESFKSYTTTEDFVEHMKEQKGNGGDEIYKAFSLSQNLLKMNKKDFIREIETNQRNKITPDLILSTAHISKGLEWDSVILSDDLFHETWNRKKTGAKFPVVNLNVLNKVLKNANKDLDPFNNEFPIEYPNWIVLEDSYNQQANLLYVSMTRAKKSIWFPEKLVEKLKLNIEYEKKEDDE